MKRPPDGAGVVVMVGMEKGAGAVVLGGKSPPGGAALEVVLSPPKGEAWVLCEVDGSKMDLRFPWASTVGFRLRPPKGFVEPEVAGPDDGGPKSDIFAGLVGRREGGVRRTQAIEGLRKSRIQKSGSRRVQCGVLQPWRYWQ